MSAESLTEQESRDLTIELLQERIGELEGVLDDRGWQRIHGDSSEYEFSRAMLDFVMRWSRAAKLANPIINHAVEVQSHYVFGQGMSVKAAHPDIDAYIRRWMEQPDHQDELFGHEALIAAEEALTTDGNLFWVFFPNRTTGEVRLRSIPLEQIRQIITNPDDRRDPWYYLRAWSVRKPDGSTETREALYPDWRHDPRDKPESATIGGKAYPVVWDAPVYHVRVGGLRTMLFGVPETYPALPWARSVKEFHETSATVRQAQARFAAKVTAPNKRGVAAAKAKMGTALTTDTVRDTNPPPADGSLFIGSQGFDYNVLKLAGQAPAHGEARGLVLMTAAGVGIPETILMGDADVGNLATSKTLDRPTELKMRARQTLWMSVLRSILDYVVDWALTAPQGELRRLATRAADGTVTMRVDPETGKPVDRHIDIDMPSILERDVKQFVEAVLMAYTNGGLTPRQMAALVMSALGMDDLDEELAELFPEDEGDDGEEAPTPEQEQEARFAEALADMRAALVALAERGT